MFALAPTRERLRVACRLWRHWWTVRGLRVSYHILKGDHGW